MSTGDCSRYQLPPGAEEGELGCKSARKIKQNPFMNLRPISLGLSDGQVPQRVVRGLEGGLGLGRQG